MVDFQSRETRRGSQTDDESDDEEQTDGDQTAEPGDESDTREAAEAEVNRGVAVISVGGTDDAEGGDPAGDAVVSSIERAEKKVVTRETAEATYDAVQGTVDRLFRRRGVSAIVTVGGIGIGPADATVEAVEPLLEKRLPGFGELFRLQYFEQVGPAVVGMRPIAGVSDGVPVFCLPGKADTARFAVEKVLAETLDSLVAAASGEEAHN
ncbi:Molybdenum cofactor biosynthesis protein [Halorhabdus tiamatea SARL4B]|uniref:Molybdenum cofactor biosynthesis protein n=1 Tax=Halorhabdus tiamatea SARL4B TaxID=1033806 RepID=F7PGZ9_9EURY|nr:molybdopterin-binding protein [Halorhabdus tiamatea]ERJ05643.1 Molybdenum cofactor biosynthesis protein [Halorhabdus tiamatea SARL4B]CCQ32470.1 molybdenum cofactor biosynthesis protein B [Halorhabdus tiamatea SARL4B]